VTAGAHRELKEETGYTAKRIRKLLEIFPSPGLLGERMDIFLAEGLTKGKAQPEDDEKITQAIVTLPERKLGFAQERFVIRSPWPVFCSIRGSWHADEHRAIFDWEM